MQRKGLLELECTDHDKGIFDKQKQKKSENSFWTANVMSIEFQFDGDSTRWIENDESHERILRGDFDDYP
jgi:hypothetical protein